MGTGRLGCTLLIWSGRVYLTGIGYLTGMGVGVQYLTDMGWEGTIQRGGVT